LSDPASVDGTGPVGATPDGGGPTLHAVMVTFQRPVTARQTIESVLAQTRPPDGVVVVIDNESSDVVASWAHELGIRYLKADNAGPAGGIALGMREILGDAADGDLVLLVDDDDPPPFPTAVESLERALLDARRDDRTVGGIGLAGARFDARLGRIRRVLDDQLEERTDVDYIGGNQLPIYLVDAIRAVGVFDEKLFFGFEELEFGLRLRRGGWRLLVPGSITRGLRQRNHRLGLGKRVAGRGLPPWRRYYSARNIVLISRRYGGPGASLIAAFHSGCLAAVRALTVRRAVAEAGMAMRGALDGICGRTGRRVDPSPKANP
jgi:glycosyltransferase involved in cell wall biosynthesis